MDFTIPALQEQLLYLRTLIEKDATNNEVADYVLKETNIHDVVQG